MGYLYCPEVVLGLSPVLLAAKVLHKRGAAGVDHEVEEVDAGVLADEEQPHTQCLQQVVDKVELHRHQVSLLPALLGSLA